ncbi:hypothetical protein GH714_008987 [Hevea brasiliensis]|uniref:Uncharacterized protein n=1 Tax=Hevea brasiliensis TaxID=3981 RepID=A0A6A6KC36_HEVBR|nr:hypothetical protein GH714_008987 [Hevea brasiliensis]
MEKDAAGHRKKKTKRKFLRAVKAVLFETTLAKRIKKKAFPGKTKQSKGDPSAKAEKNLMGSSSFQSLSRKNDGTNVTFAPIMNSSARTSWLFLLLVTLLVLVFWGKVYAILCTSTWLFFVPNWNSGKKLLKNKANSGSMDLDEYKKNRYGRYTGQGPQPCSIAPCELRQASLVVDFHLPKRFERFK